MPDILTLYRRLRSKIWEKHAQTRSNLLKGYTNSGTKAGWLGLITGNMLSPVWHSVDLVPSESLSFSM